MSDPKAPDPSQPEGLMSDAAELTRREMLSRMKVAAYMVSGVGAVVATAMGVNGCTPSGPSGGQQTPAPTFSPTETPTPSPTVAPTATPLISINIPSLTFNHIVGTTPCPQRIGTVRVTNIFGSQILLVFAPQSNAVALNFTSTPVLQNQFCDLNVDFTCLQTTNVNTTIRVTATAGSVTDIRSITVTGNVSR